MSKNICIVAGARPNFIKVAPVIRAIRNAQKSGVDVEYQLVYTGRKDDPTLESSLFSDLDIQSPDVFLEVDCENMNELTGMVMAQFERYLQDHPTDVVIVVDDLASTMAVAIVTKKQGVQLAHIAAGTRSFDITMPKEINRLVIDGLSDITCCCSARRGWNRCSPTSRTPVPKWSSSTPSRPWPWKAWTLRPVPSRRFANAPPCCSSLPRRAACPSFW